MTKVIGVRFRTAGKIYYFDPAGLEIKTGDNVIVETARGIEYGYVVLGNREVADDKVIQPLKQVIRMATNEDRAIEARNKEKEKEAFKICLEKIHKRGLEMKLIDAEYTFDNNKVLFYFTADGRIDFRELVKDLAAVFKTRIELRQVGVRDETKILGGIGICGRALCCHSYLSEFIPVSIKMAKEQNLSLNPTKISGVCGRLMCCLKNEEETYQVLNSKLPNMGDLVTTEEGLKGEVHSVNVLRQTVKVLMTVDGDEKEIREYPVDELKFKPRRKKDKTKDGQKDSRKDEEREEQPEVQLDSQKDEQRESRRDGQKDGRRDSQKDGRRDGQRDGYKEGYRDGRRDGPRTGRRDDVKDSRRESQKDSYRDGQKDSRKDGHREGQKDSHRDGHKDRYKNGNRENRDNTRADHRDKDRERDKRDSRDGDRKGQGSTAAESREG
ncbi:MAG: stage 0 sporulation protein [Lachnospiraceae bacterium]|nr:stage 0 sporulation protein [Lachnospiraceae bacterium]